MSTTTKSLGSGGYGVVWSQSEVLGAMLTADGPVRMAAVSDDDGWRKLRDTGLIRKSPTTPTPDAERCYWMWEINPDYEGEIREELESTPHLPCGLGHTGWVTVEAGKRYECRECGAEHDRETIEALEAER